MKKATLLVDIVNTVLDRDIIMAPVGAKVTILEDHGTSYEVAYFDGQSPSTTFYVTPNQVRIHND